MGLWLHLHLGPVGLTARGRRKPQSYRAYKASRERRTQHAERYQAEHAAKKTRQAAPAAASVDTDFRDPQYASVENSDLIRLLSMWREQGAAMHKVEIGSRAHRVRRIRGCEAGGRDPGARHNRARRAGTTICAGSPVPTSTATASRRCAPGCATTKTSPTASACHSTMWTVRSPIPPG